MFVQTLITFVHRLQNTCLEGRLFTSTVSYDIVVVFNPSLKWS